MFLSTLRSLIDGVCGILGGLEKISKTNSQGDWNSRGDWKNLENLIAGAGWSFAFSFFLF